MSTDFSDHLWVKIGRFLRKWLRSVPVPDGAGSFWQLIKNVLVAGLLGGMSERTVCLQRSLAPAGSIVAKITQIGRFWVFLTMHCKFAAGVIFLTMHCKFAAGVSAQAEMICAPKQSTLQDFLRHRWRDEEASGSRFETECIGKMTQNRPIFGLVRFQNGNRKPVRPGNGALKSPTTWTVLGCKSFRPEPKPLQQTCNASSKRPKIGRFPD